MKLWNGTDDLPYMPGDALGLNPIGRLFDPNETFDPFEYYNRHSHDKVWWEEKDQVGFEISYSYYLHNPSWYDAIRKYVQADLW